MSRLNILLRTILDAPTIAEGLSSDEAIVAIRAIDLMIREFAGAMFVDWDSDLGEESLDRFDTCLEYWTCLAPKAAEMFMEGIGHTSLSG
jgi:hypothetical protein